MASWSVDDMITRQGTGMVHENREGNKERAELKRKENQDTLNTEGSPGGSRSRSGRSGSEL